MIVQDLYRVMCGNDTIRIMSHDDKKQLFEGKPDDIPLALMEESVFSLKAVTGKLVVWIH